MDKKVLVIGLGNMGAALASTLLDAGYETLVWNRTAAKAEPLVERGAKQVATVAEGLEAVTNVVICVGDYAQSREVLEDAGSLEGKLLFQLTSAVPSDAIDFEQWAIQKGGRCIDGAILAFPSGVGKPECALIVAGSAAAWPDAEPIVKLLGPASLYLGENVGAPPALDFALILPSLAVQLAVIQGAHMLEKAGFPLGGYRDMLSAIYGGALGEQLGSLTDKIANEELAETEASLGTWHEAARHGVEGFTADGFDMGFVAGLMQTTQRGVDAGYGAEDLGALIKVLRRGG